MGLGNPGPDYQNTRHNAGFWFLDQWAGILGSPFQAPWFRPYLFSSITVGQDRLVLIKPRTFMNRSGIILPKVLKKFGAKPEDVLVVFDQMDLPPGRVRLKPHGSSAGHNGLKSIDEVLGAGYHRLAVGIGRPSSGVSVVDHVLGVPLPEDRQAIDTALERIVLQLHQFWNRGWEPLIHVVNQRHHPSS